MEQTTVGIDFGTATTIVAFTRRGDTRVFNDPASELVQRPTDPEVIPSYVSFHPSGRVPVGRIAQARRSLDPLNTVHLFKRIMGLEWVIVGGGSRSLKVKVDPAALAALPGAEIIEGLAKEPPPG